MQESDRMSDQDIDKLLENFEFSAITDGLGFHHSVGETSKVEKSLKQKATELDQDLQRHLKNLKSKKTGSHLNRGDLAPFYEQEEVPKKPAEVIEDLIEQERSVETITAASSAQRLVAWTLDMTFVLVLSAITTLLSFYSADIPINMKSLFSDAGTTLFLTMMTLYYLLYFTVLDATEHSTLGKRIFGLKVLKTMKPMSLSLSLKRTLFSLISFALAGLPTLLKTQDMFFETVVIKK